jgi:hypothetical protein
MRKGYSSYKVSCSSWQEIVPVDIPRDKTHLTHLVGLAGAGMALAVLQPMMIPGDQSAATPQSSEFRPFCRRGSAQRARYSGLVSRTRNLA